MKLYFYITSAGFFQVGDLFNLLSAIFFGVHMVRTERISRTTKKENFTSLLGYEVIYFRSTLAENSCSVGQLSHQVVFYLNSKKLAFYCKFLVS